MNALIGFRFELVLWLYPCLADRTTSHLASATLREHQKALEVFHYSGWRLVRQTRGSDLARSRDRDKQSVRQTDQAHARSQSARPCHVVHAL